MGRKRIIPELEEMENKVHSNAKTYMRYKEAADFFSMSERTFIDFAKEANAVRKIKGVCLVNVKVIENYIEDMYA